MTLPTAFPSPSVVRRLIVAWIGLALILPAVATATVPTGSGFSDTLFAGGLSNPTAMAFAPDGRLFVAQQGGDLRVIKGGVLLTAPFVHLDVDSNGERGLLGVAFDPTFPTNAWVYVYYTLPGSPAHNRVSRFMASGDTATGSENVILNLDNLSDAHTNHNGGAIHFGPDGKLYVAVGENATGSNSQSLANRLSKILRINPDGTIPTDNPTSFGGITGAPTGLNKAIWAVGLRNPYTFAFQPRTGRLFIDDVGEGTWEEINDGIAGSNYGWNIYEGRNVPPVAGFRDPLFQYGHVSFDGAGNACAITGGAFYNPATVQFPVDYVGDYFFADLCGGWIHRLDVASGTVTSFATNASNPVDLQVGSDGSLYYLSRGQNSVFRITYTATALTITNQPGNQAVNVGQSATFVVSAAGGTPPLAYQWQRNHVDIPNATSATYTTPATTLGDNGAFFRAKVSSGPNFVFSNDATLTVNQVTSAPAFVKLIGNATLSRSGNASITISVPAGGVGAGHTVIVAATVGTFAGVVACKDSRGNIYSVDADTRATGRVFVCSARNIQTPLVSGDTITATYPGFSGVSAATASEFSGVSTVGARATKSGNSVAPAVAVSAGAGSLVFGAVIFSATPTFAPCAGFALTGEATGGAGSGRKVVGAEWSAAPTARSYTACGTLSAPRPWQAAAVVYGP